MSGARPRLGHKRDRWRVLLGLGLLRFRRGSRVPLKAGLDHEVDGVAVLDVVLLEELGVREGLALEQQPLDVCWGRTGL